MKVVNKIILGSLLGFLVTTSAVLLVFLNLKEVVNLLIFLILFGIFIYVAKKSHPLFGDREEQLMIFVVGLLWGVFWILGIYISSKFPDFKLFGISIVLFSAIVELIAKKSVKVDTAEELIDELKVTISEKSAFKAMYSFLISSIVFWYLSTSSGLNLKISVYDISSLPLIILISQLIIFRAYYTLKFS
jgi:hypothetical protein